MARTAITVIRRHGAEKFELVAGPEVEITDHLAAVREMMRSSEHPEIAEIQYWENGMGVAKKRRFTDPAARIAAEKAAVAAQSADITDPVSSEADPAATTPGEGELTADAPAPQPQEPVPPPASGASPAKAKRAR